MKILISTPIYKDQVGGPAKHASILFNQFRENNIVSTVVSYGSLIKLPTGIRHILYFIKILPKVVFYDIIFSLDYFSVGLPSLVASKLFGKKHIIRVGGDFLWELYLERSREKIFLSDFYNLINKGKIILTKKEQIIFRISRFVLQKSDIVIFSTKWQRDIFTDSYGLDKNKLKIIENEYDSNQKRNIVPKKRIIFSPSRKIFLKNQDSLVEAFDILKQRFQDLQLDTKTRKREEMIEALKEAYCLVVPSISEVSPNIVLEAISFGIPVVLTKDCGINDRVKDIVVSVDPTSPQSIADGIERLLSAEEYNKYMNKISSFTFTHTKEDIFNEFVNIINPFTK